MIEKYCQLLELHKTGQKEELESIVIRILPYTWDRNYPSVINTMTSHHKVEDIIRCSCTACRKTIKTDLNKIIREIAAHQHKEAREYQKRLEEEEKEEVNS